MSSDVSGRTILITGASSGLGEYFAKLMAGAGAKVVVAARRIDRLQDLVEQIRRVNGTAIAVSMDVTNEDSVIKAFNQAEQEIGPVDSVIANAGISHVGSALAIKADDFDHIMAVNVRGAFLTAREGARRMIQHKADGRITLIASIGGLAPLAGLTAYSTSKAAVVMLGQSLALEWMNKGINVNVVCPGYIRTELNSAWFDSEQGHKQIASFPRRRLMDCNQLDDILLLLASGSGSRFITGSVFKIDDGQLLA